MSEPITWDDFNIEEYSKERQEGFDLAFKCDHTEGYPKVVWEFSSILDTKKRERDEIKGDPGDLMGYPCGLIVMRAEVWNNILVWVNWHAEFHRTLKYLTTEKNNSNEQVKVTSRYRPIPLRQRKVW